VPFTATSQSTFFTQPFDPGVDLSTAGLMVTYRLCVATTTTVPARYTFQPFVSNTAGTGNYAGAMPLSALATCPAMTTLAITLAGGGLIATSVNNIGIQLSSAGSGPFGTAAIELDSITVTPGNPVGPFDFAASAGTFEVAAYMPVAGSTITWQAAP
jgi:hypothetical protein